MPGYCAGSIQSPCSRHRMFMRVSARLHATAAPDAPAPTINTSTGSLAIRDEPPRIDLARTTAVRRPSRHGSVRSSARDGTVTSDGSSQRDPTCVEVRGETPPERTRQLGFRVRQVDLWSHAPRLLLEPHGLPGKPPPARGGAEEGDELVAHPQRGVAEEERHVWVQRVDAVQKRSHLLLGDLA